MTAGAPQSPQSPAGNCTLHAVLAQVEPVELVLATDAQPDRGLEQREQQVHRCERPEEQRPPCQIANDATLADVPFLHFNVCFYKGIEEAIARGLGGFEPGAGGEHKVARGFEPTVTHSVHYLGDRRLARAVAEHLVGERSAVDEHVSEAEPVLKR